MKKTTSFSMVVLLGLSLAAPAWADAPADKAPGKEQTPGKPGAGPSNKPNVQPGAKAGPQGPGGGPHRMGPGGVGPGGTGPRGMGPGGGPRGMTGHGVSPEDMAKRAETMKERMAQHAEKVAARSKELREKAANARAKGDTKQAEQLEKAAERLEKSPMTPERGPGWQKAMERRKRARLKPLWKQYGERLKNPDVQAEFKKHAMRMARLDRMRDLARNNPDEEARKKLIERINGSVAKENARHRQTLRQMMSNKDQVVSANQPAAGEPAAATAQVPATPPDNAAEDGEEQQAEEAK